MATIATGGTGPFRLRIDLVARNLDIAVTPLMVEELLTFALLSPQGQAATAPDQGIRAEWLTGKGVTEIKPDGTYEHGRSWMVRFVPQDTAVQDRKGWDDLLQRITTHTTGACLHCLARLWVGDTEGYNPPDEDEYWDAHGGDDDPEDGN